jgi:hypothetical protein
MKQLKKMKRFSFVEKRFIRILKKEEKEKIFGDFESTFESEVLNFSFNYEREEFNS